MGFISDLAAKAEVFPDRNRGESLWRQVFGQAATDKERSKPVSRPVPGGTFARSASSDVSTARLLQALRSMAPGGWSDDRWEQTRHFVGIAYVAIHRICTQYQRSEYQVFRRDPNSPDGKVPVNEGEPGYDLVKLLARPNRQDSWGKLMYRWGQQKYLTGTALTWMVPNKLGTPMELYCIPTAIAIPQPAINPDYPDGYYRIQPVYPYGPFSTYPTPNSAVGAPIPAQWMMRFQFPHPLLRYEGYAPLTGLRLHLDEVEMIDRSRHYKMRGSINPSAVLNFEDAEGMQPLPEPEIERIRSDFEAVHQGPENHGRLYVGSPGTKLEEWGASPKEMDYQGGWEQLVSFALGGFGITKPAAGMIEDASYASLFATLKQLYWLTLEPDVEDIAAELSHYLCKEEYGWDGLFIEIRCKKIDDHDVKLAKLDKAIQGKCITKNQLLKELDLPITQEEWGEDMAGDPTQKETDSINAKRSEAAVRAAETRRGNSAGASPQEMGTDVVEPPEIASSRPKPGKLSEGSLGPRMKRLPKAELPELRFRYEDIVKACRNGHVEVHA